MGAPKQKWTAEEEAALKAGIKKHGAGKWRTILRDPEFSDVLTLRSNVDLKDKWRNMNGMGSGSVAREKFKVSNRKSRSGVKHEDGDYTDELANSAEFAADMDDDFVDVVPLAVSGGPSQVPPDVDQERLDRIIMEAIRTLKEPSGSQKTSIGNYIELHYEPPQDFKELLSTKLRALAASGRLIKVKRRYRIAPYPYLSDQRSPKAMLLEGSLSQREDQPSGSDNEELKIKHIMTRDSVDAELMQMWNMEKEAAAAHAVRAVAEAEAIMAEAEAAAREAEAAEAEAETVKAFAEATRSNVNNGRQATKLVIRACV